MVDAQKLLGVDMMTAHWEFTYGAERVKEIVDKQFKGHARHCGRHGTVLIAIPRAAGTSTENWLTGGRKQDGRRHLCRHPYFAYTRSRSPSDRLGT